MLPATYQSLSLTSAYKRHEDAKKREYVTGHEKIGLMCTQNLTTFLDFKLQ